MDWASAKFNVHLHNDGHMTGTDLCDGTMTAIRKCVLWTHLELLCKHGFVGVPGKPEIDVEFADTPSPVPNKGFRNANKELW